jgi:hypothetical protein
LVRNSDNRHYRSMKHSLPWIYNVGELGETLSRSKRGYWDPELSDLLLDTSDLPIQHHFNFQPHTYTARRETSFTNLISPILSIVSALQSINHFYQQTAANVEKDGILL